MKFDEITEVAIIGLGTMGSVFAQIFARSGYRVKGFEADAASQELAERIIKKNLEAECIDNSALKESAETVFSRIEFAESIAKAVEHADIVIEAVNENRDAKRSVFQEIDRFLPENSKILSNTSSLNIYELLPTRRQEHSIIAHWFAPPHIIPLVEIVLGEKTSDETVSLTEALMRDLGKVPVVIRKYVPGFVVNRIQRALGREVFHLLDEEIISAEDLDLAIKASIAPRMMVLGVVQRYDFTGLELSARNLKDTSFYDPPVDNEPKSLVSRIENGDLGVKSGRGFYDYGDRRVEDILRERDLHLKRVVDETTFCFEKKRLV